MLSFLLVYDLLSMLALVKLVQLFEGWKVKHGLTVL
jgi:hypothetical protein